MRVQGSIPSAGWRLGPLLRGRSADATASTSGAVAAVPRATGPPSASKTHVRPACLQHRRIRDPGSGHEFTPRSICSPTGNGASCFDFAGRMPGGACHGEPARQPGPGKRHGPPSPAGAGRGPRAARNRTNGIGKSGEPPPSAQGVMHTPTWSRLPDSPSPPVSVRSLPMRGGRLPRRHPAARRTDRRCRARRHGQRAERGRPDGATALGHHDGASVGVRGVSAHAHRVPPGRRTGYFTQVGSVAGSVPVAR